MKTDIKHIQERFSYMSDVWEETYRNGREDEEFCAGNQWRQEDIDARGDRPTIVCDEINAYVNKVSNNLRMNKRGIVVSPRGYGADEKGAELTANVVRNIQYDSRAQDSFITASDNAIRRGFGFFRVGLEYISPTSFQQRIVFKRISNPDRIMVDPDFQASNAQDMRDAFVLEEMDRDKYERLFPGEDLPSLEMLTEVASSWIRPQERILVAEYWRIEETPDELLRIRIGDAEENVLASELKKGRRIRIQDDLLIGEDGQPIGAILQRRKTTQRQVVQYLTNGVKILMENPWPGKYIPIVAMFGREMWLKGPRRILMSLTRLSQDPQRLLNYYRSNQAEVVGLSPKVPWVGVKGQFEGSEEDWATANREPKAFLEFNATTPATGQALLGPPQRLPYEPPVQALEIGAESARRAVMAAMGGDVLPTVAQRQNQKSGIALQRIDDAQNMGFYHFTKAYEDMICQAGRITVDLIPTVYGQDGAEVPVMLPDETKKTEVIESGDIFAGEFEVTVKAGPTQDSEREEALEFASQLTTPELLGAALADNPKASKIAALAIKLRQGGPVMDEIAETLDPAPTDQDPEAMLGQAAAQIQQYEKAIQALNAHAEELEEQLRVEKEKNQTQLQINEQDNATKLQIEAMRMEIDRMKLELEAQKIAVDAQAKAEQNAIARRKMRREFQRDETGRVAAMIEREEEGED